MKYNSLIPFFVVDRPMSLELLKFCGIDKQKGKLGLMGHANTTTNFQKLFKNFYGKKIIKMVDSGVFTREGCRISYEELFQIYSNMDADYGIMIDFLKDKDKTIESAKNALKVYDENDFCFELVGVAQGDSIKEYLDCYQELKSLGFDCVAIGGLLKKTFNSGRYAKVRDEKFLINVISAIRKVDPKGWLFTLGVYHPKRHIILENYGVYGADYKGWIFNYKTPKNCIENTNRILENLESELVENKKLDMLLEKRRLLSKNKDCSNSIDLAEINSEILNLRKIIAKNLDNREYKLKVKKLEKFMTMDRETKRIYRFNQIRSHLYNHVFSFFKDYFLIISCSEKKSSIPNPSPAINLYDGPFYKMIRKFESENSLSNFHIMIISARYGLLGLYDLISKYNQKMTPDSAKKLNKKITKEMVAFLEDKNYDEILISMGKTYCLTLENLEFNKPIKYAEGRIGEKLSTTKSWIEEKKLK